MTQRVPWFRVLVEGVVIVGSILLAFGIDAWWDGRQVDARRVELLHALEADFVGTRVLIGEAIASDTNYLDRAEAFLAAAGDRIPLSPDSIRYLSVGIVGGISGFTPSLINYNAARSSGEISLVQSQALRTAFADFDWYYEGYSGLADNLLESFYLGSLNDLRSELVTLSLLNPIGGRREVPLRFVQARRSQCGDTASRRVCRRRTDIRVAMEYGYGPGCNARRHGPDRF